jgi:hypothetical protein
MLSKADTIADTDGSEGGMGWPDETRIMSGCCGCSISLELGLNGEKAFEAGEIVHTPETCDEAGGGDAVWSSVDGSDEDIAKGARAAEGIVKGTSTDVVFSSIATASPRATSPDQGYAGTPWHSS